jgi:predicted Fe-Mo cluster-binding NifX family protein
VRVAFAVWDGRMAPVFDVSREALVLTIDGGETVSRTTESVEAPTLSLKAGRLEKLGVQTLVCGAISEPLQHELSARGVKVIAFVAGDLDQVVESFLAGRLPTRTLSMPGYCGGQRRVREGRRVRRGGRCRRRGERP